MPIQVPGRRDRHGRIKSAKRSVVAVLSLTAMVDLFTVLVVFLLQNYATTGEILEIPEGVSLPQAVQVKDLKPANVVIVSKNEVKLNNTRIVDIATVRAQQDWMVVALRLGVEELIRKGEDEKKAIAHRLREAVERIKENEVGEVDSFRKMTIQADQDVDFLTLKKVMYSITEAGVYEINFAVLKKVEDGA
jgi:biopolymer transport protein ExbD